MKKIFTLVVAVLMVVACLPLSVKAAKYQNMVGLPQGSDQMFVYDNGKKTNTHLHADRMTPIKNRGSILNPLVLKGKFPLVGWVTDTITVDDYDLSKPTEDQADALGIAQILALNKNERLYRDVRGLDYKLQNPKVFKNKIAPMAIDDLKQFIRAHNSSDKSQLQNQSATLVESWRSIANYNFELDRYVPLASDFIIGYAKEDGNYDDASPSLKNATFMDVVIKAKTSRKIGEHNYKNEEDGEDPTMAEVIRGGREVMEKNDPEAKSSSIEGTGKTTDTKHEYDNFHVHYNLVDGKWQLSWVRMEPIPWGD
ncbi:hypothetical protein [Limosilactobacillus oris]|uniref:hypothetical protein n=1 Tax=Limosilactobacillus oris TaxID=1632 RepID=UPI00259AA62C|nr:hypothetical protein [Limosilactobacillus oris]